jgi:nicotinamide-nucleotide amidase
MGTELIKLRLRVQRQTTVPDGNAITQAMAEAMERSDAVIVTGGIGPTSDDLTREAAAEVLGVDLITDEAALRSLEEFFAKRNRVMAEDNPLSPPRMMLSTTSLKKQIPSSMEPSARSNCHGCRVC